VQEHSAEMDAALRNSHTAVSRADLLYDGRIIRHLETYAGSVTADRTAAQMRSFAIDIIDRDGTLTPTDMTSDLAPFGSRIQLYRGVRLVNVETVGAQYDAAHPWTPTTPSGSMTGTKIDTDGGLVIGP